MSKRKQISSSLYYPLVSLILVVGIAGCYDEPIAPNDVSSEISTPGPLLNPAATASYAIVTADEQAAAEYLARALALSLSRPDVRLEIKTALATSTVKERKLHLASFLQGRGGKIFAVLGREGSLTVPNFQAAVARVRDLEFYMPEDAHRERWTGDQYLLVAVALSERDAPVAFNTLGERMSLSSTPPDTPTLVLVPTETDFSAQIALNRQRRGAVTCLPVATESLEAAGARCTGTANPKVSPAAAVTPPTARLAKVAPSSPLLNFADDPQIMGLYMQFLRVLDTGEPWWMGDPEIEVHIVAKQSAEGGELRDYQCSGEHANRLDVLQPGIRDQLYVFDQNNPFWSGSGVLLANRWQMDEIQRDEREGYLITVWEDDNEACAIREDANVSLQTLGVSPKSS